MSSPLFLVLGLRRSGNHAVFNWLLPQMPGKVRVMNDHLLDEVATGRRPLFEARPTFHYYNPDGRPHALVDQGHREMVQELSWEATVRQLPAWKRWLLKGVDPYASKTEKSVPHAVKDSAQLACDWNLVGLENYTPEEAAGQWSRVAAAGGGEPLPLDLSPAEGLRIVVIVRSPFNTLASVMRGILPVYPNHVSPENFARTWCAYAREIAGETQYLGALGTVVPLVYDRWFADIAYRAELAAKLGLDFNDGGIGEMSMNGFGSSFDKLTQNDPRKLKVLERWREYEGDARYRLCLADPELLRLQRLLFGEPPFLP